MPADGGPAEQLTHGGGYRGFEARDGRFVYYAAPSEGGGIWRVPASGGQEEEVVKGPVAFQDFALGARGIYYLQSRAAGVGGTYDIRYVDIESMKVTTLFHKQGPVRIRTLAASPDEKSLLYAEEPVPESELMLVDYFR
jgi:hypothetical protein